MELHSCVAQNKVYRNARDFSEVSPVRDLSSLSEQTLSQL